MIDSHINVDINSITGGYEHYRNTPTGDNRFEKDEIHRLIEKIPTRYYPEKEQLKNKLEK